MIAAEALQLTLHPASHPGHDAFDEKGDVQIKITGQRGKSVSLYADCERLVVLKIITLQEAEIVYDGPGKPAWGVAAKVGKNGQHVVSLKKLKEIAASQRPA